MSWLDPDRLAALYGQPPSKKVGPPADAPTPPETQAPEALPPKKQLARRAECCHKYNQGKRCIDCPLT